MFKSLKNNFKKAVSVSAALLLCFGAFAAIPKISVKAETAALYKDEFVSESGVFNTEAEGFPSSYIFDLSARSCHTNIRDCFRYYCLPESLPCDNSHL